MFEVFSVFKSRSVKMSTPKWKRNLFDFKQKHEIIAYAMKHHKSTQQQVADYLSFLGKLPVKCKIVSDILSNKEIYDSTPHK